MEWLRKLPDLRNLLYQLPTEETQVILDPLSCMVRLAILNYKPSGTKISISDNKIYYQAPNILQGALRWKNNDTRLDIHNLHQTILKCLEWYDLKDENIKYICEMAKAGLTKLSSCYNTTSNITTHSLTYYIKIIETNIQHPEMKTAPNSKSFTDLWTPNQIRCIYLLLHDMDTHFSNSLITAIEDLLIYKDHQVNNLVKKYSTSL